MTEAKYLGLTANELAKIASDLDAENSLLRDLCEDMYRQCGASMGYDDPLLKELGIEAES